MTEEKEMKVLILTTFSHTGGAAIAAHRLTNALRRYGVDVAMLTRHNLQLPGWKPKWGGLPFLRERLSIWWADGMRRRNLFAVDFANYGDDVTKTKAFREADVIHLHWVNQGFISLRVLRKIVDSGKRVVWTLHDQWPTTGICHYSGDCRQYETTCEACPTFPRAAAARVFAQKKAVYRRGRITFVTCSEWLGRLARKSALTQGQEVVAIPNTIDTAVFCPRDRQEARQRLGLPREGTMVLFGCQKVTDRRKGLDYLVEALGELSGVTVLLVGGSAADTEALMPEGVRVVSIGQVDGVEKMALLYAAADTFVTPSLQDNLPNTIMEAMACGTPCVGFDVGGIPEMIDHQQNGFVARYQDAASLAEGIRYVTDPVRAEHLGAAAREKVMRCYCAEEVAERYLKVYGSEAGASLQR